MSVRCNTSFFDTVSGYVFPVGTRVPTDSPVLARHPQFFDAAPTVVEAATCAPGEKRAVKPRATRKAAPK